MAHFILVLALSQATAATPASEVRGPHQMTRAEIRTYNATLDRSDPAYIRCKREQEIGSLVRVRMTCRTNEQWRRVEQDENDTAREIVDRVQTANGNP